MLRKWKYKMCNCILFSSVSAIISCLVAYKCVLIVCIITGCCKMHQLSVLQLILQCQQRSIKVIRYLMTVWNYRKSTNRHFCKQRPPSSGSSITMQWHFDSSLWVTLAYKKKQKETERQRDIRLVREQDISCRKKTQKGLRWQTYWLLREKEVRPETHTEEKHYDNNTTHIWRTAGNK